ncbi:MAG: OmpH family outer membrane protein [Armatimonadetes bacterium]|nr:OmpH family outer membrane protein [Armatimonadota bacterium]
MMKQLILLMLPVMLLAGCAGPRVGVVDTNRLLNESVLALSAQKQLNEQEKLMTADLQFQSRTLKGADFEQLRQNHFRDLARMKQELEDRLNRRVREVVEDVARQERVRIVIAKGSVICQPDDARCGGRDITQKVLDKLK